MIIRKSMLPVRVSVLQQFDSADPHGHAVLLFARSVPSKSPVRHHMGLVGAVPQNEACGI